jgi:hypothetical protein
MTPEVRRFHESVPSYSHCPGSPRDESASGSTAQLKLLSSHSDSQKHFEWVRSVVVAALAEEGPVQSERIIANGQCTDRTSILAAPGHARTPSMPTDVNRIESDTFFQFIIGPLRDTSFPARRNWRRPI